MPKQVILEISRNFDNGHKNSWLHFSDALDSKDQSPGALIIKPPAWGNLVLLLPLDTPTCLLVEVTVCEEMSLLAELPALPVLYWLACDGFPRATWGGCFIQLGGVYLAIRQTWQPRTATPVLDVTSVARLKSSLTARFSLLLKPVLWHVLQDNVSVHVEE